MALDGSPVAILISACSPLSRMASAMASISDVLSVPFVAPVITRIVTAARWLRPNSLANWHATKADSDQATTTTSRRMQIDAGKAPSENVDGTVRTGHGAERTTWSTVPVKTYRYG